MSEQVPIPIKAYQMLLKQELNLKDTNDFEGLTQLNNVLAEAKSSPQFSKYVEPERLTPEVKGFIEQRIVASVTVREHEGVDVEDKFAIDKNKSFTNEQKVVEAKEDAKLKMVLSKCIFKDQQIVEINKLHETVQAALEKIYDEIGEEESFSALDDFLATTKIAKKRIQYEALVNLKNDLVYQFSILIKLYAIPEDNPVKIKTLLEYSQEQGDEVGAELYQKLQNLYQLLLDRELIEHPVIIPPDFVQKTQPNAAFERAHEIARLLQSLPECFEKMVANLAYYYSLVIQKYNRQAEEVEPIRDNHFHKEDFFAQISSLVDQIEKSWEIDQFVFNHYEIKDLVTQILSSGKNQLSFELIFKEIIKIFDEHIVPFNFGDFLELYKETVRAGKQIKDKSIILLLGQTGVGKSTLTQYLCGCKMGKVIKTQADGTQLQHFESIEQIRDPDLLKVITRPDARSITRFVTPVKIAFQGPVKTIDLYVCDTPGFGDSQRCEIDLSNQLGLEQAVINSAQIYPVFIFSYKNFGSRYEILKANIIYYAKMIKGLPNKVQKFNYFFTNIPKDQEGQMLATLKNVYNYLEANEQQNESLKLILEDMIQKAINKKLIFINPLDGRFKYVLESIVKNSSIDNPYSTIQMSISEKTNEKINNQISLIKGKIIHGLKNQRVEIIKHNLEEFEKIVGTLTKNPQYKSRYESALQDIEEYIRTIFKDYCIPLISKLQPGNKVSEADIESFKKGIIFFDKLYFLKEKFLKESDSIKSSSDLIAEIIKTLKIQIKGLLNNDLADPHWLDLIKKSNLIEENFPQVQNLTNEIVDQYCIKVQQIGESAKVSLNTLDIFVQYGDKSAKKYVSETDYFSESFGEDDNSELMKGAGKENNPLKRQKFSIRQDKRLSHQVYFAQIKKLFDAKTLIQGTNQKIDSEIENQINKSFGSIKHLFRKIEGKIEKYNSDIKLEPQMLNDFKVCFKTLVSFEQESIGFNIKKLIKVTEAIKASKTYVIDKLLSRFNALAGQIKLILSATSNHQTETKTKTRNIKSIFDEMQLISQIEEMNSLTQNQFLNFANQAMFIAGECVRDIEIITEKLDSNHSQLGPTSSEQQMDYITLKTLDEKISTISDLHSILVNQENYFENLKQQLNSLLSSVIERIQNELDGKLFNQDHVQNISLFVDAMKKFNYIVKIKSKLIDENKEFERDFGNGWTIQIMITLEKISSFGYQQNQATGNEEARILEVKDYKFLKKYQAYVDELVAKRVNLYLPQSHNLFMIKAKLYAMIEKQCEMITQKQDKAFEILVKFFNDEYEINSNNQGVGDSNGCNMSIINETVPILSATIKLQKFVSDQYPQYSENVKEIENIEDTVQKLKMFGKAMRMNIVKYTKINCNLKLRLLEKLVLDDDLINQDKIFSDIYNQFQVFIYQDPNTETNEVYMLYIQRQYTECKRKMDSIMNSQPETHYIPIYKRCCMKLNDDYNAKFRDAQNYLNNEDWSNINNIQTIYEKLDDLDNIKKQFSDIIIQNGIGQTMKIFIERLKSILDNFNSQYNQEKADGHLSAAFKTSNYTLDIIKKVDLKIDSSQEDIKEILLQYKEKFIQYQADIQNEVNNSMQRIQGESIHLLAKNFNVGGFLENAKIFKSQSQKILQIQTEIKNNYLKFIKVLKSNFNDTEKLNDKSIKQIKNTLKEVDANLVNLPTAVKKEVKAQIEKIRKKLEDVQKIKERRIDEALEGSGNLLSIIDILQNPLYKLTQNQELKIRKLVNEKTKTVIEDLKKNLFQCNFDEVISLNIPEVKDLLQKQVLQQLISQNHSALFDKNIRMLQEFPNQCRLVMITILQESCEKNFSFVKTPNQANNMQDASPQSMQVFSLEDAAIKLGQLIKISITPETCSQFKEYFPDFENLIKMIEKDFEKFTNQINQKQFEHAIKGEVKNMKIAIKELFKIKVTQDIMEKQEIKFLIEQLNNALMPQNVTINKFISCEETKVSFAAQLIREWILTIQDQIAQFSAFSEKSLSLIEADRISHYDTVQMSIDSLIYAKMAEEILNYDDFNISKILEQSKKIIQGQIKELIRKVLSIVDNIGDRIDKQKLEELRKYWYSMTTAKQILEINHNQMQECHMKVQKNIEKAIYREFQKSYQAMTQKAEINIVMVSQSLNQFQILKDNFPNFQVYIQSQIDEIFDIYSLKKQKMTVSQSLVQSNICLRVAQEVPSSSSINSSKV